MASKKRPLSPCNDASVCRNVGGRCWFTAAMTLIHKVYDDLPKNEMLFTAKAFADELVATCTKRKLRQTLLCERAPRRLVDAYMRYLEETNRHLQYVGSSLQLIIAVDRPFWAGLLAAAAAAPVTLIAKVSTTNGETTATFKYRGPSGLHHQTEVDVTGVPQWDTAAALAQQEGVVAAMNTRATFETKSFAPGIVFFDVRAGNIMPVPVGGHGEYLMAAIYGLRLGEVHKSIEEVTAPAQGVGIVRFDRSALAPFHNFVRFLNEVMATKAMSAKTLLGGFVTIGGAVLHQIAFVPCDGGIMLCDPDEPNCQAVTAHWPQRTIASTVAEWLGRNADHAIMEATLVVVDDQRTQRKRIRVATFADTAI